MDVHVVFPFDELNASVFQNTAIWMLKKHKVYSGKYIVHGPEAFRDIYFHADEYRVLPQLPYSDYKEVMDYNDRELLSKNFENLNTFQKVIVKTHLIGIDVKEAILSRIPAVFYHRMPFWITSFGRSRKFLYKSGIYYQVKKATSGSAFLGKASYFDFNNLTPLKGQNEGPYFQAAFQSLRSMVLEGGLYSQSEIDSRALTAISTLNHEELMNYKKIRKFIKTNQNLILIRTRNKKVATVHNAPVDKLSKLVTTLLNDGYSVINVGAPCSPLPVVHAGYLEVSHSLPPVVLMSLALEIGTVITSAGGDLYTGWAAFPGRLFTFDSEWSTYALNPPISISNARKQIGIQDIDIEAFLADNDYLSISRILKQNH